MALYHFPEEERVRRAAAAGVEDDDVLSLPGPVGPGESQQFTDQAAGTDGVGFLIGKALDLSLGIKIIKGSRSLDERLAGKDTAGLIGKENQLPAYFFCKKLPLPVDEDGTAAALGTMVANLSSHKRGWDDRWKEFSDWAVQGQEIMDRLLALVDEDTAAFNRIMAALGMPKGNDEEKAARSKALEEATLYATQVPLKTMKEALKAFPILRAMATEGNPNSV